MTRTLLISSFTFALSAVLFVGCKTNQSSSTTSSASPAAQETVAATAPAATPTATAAPAPGIVAPPVRINAGASEAFKDADGNTWIPDTGLVDGDVIERPDAQIANTKTPKIYQSEHYSMSAFSYPVPNGKYLVKLHFCETYEGITGPGERVFSFNVEGKEFKDFDVWAKAGGPMKAYVETVPVEVKDGKLDITFTPNVENPQINGIEILPAS